MCLLVAWEHIHLHHELTGAARSPTAEPFWGEEHPDRGAGVGDSYNDCTSQPEEETLSCESVVILRDCAGTTIKHIKHITLMLSLELHNITDTDKQPKVSSM